MNFASNDDLVIRRFDSNDDHEVNDALLSAPLPPGQWHTDDGYTDIDGNDCNLVMEVLAALHAGNGGRPPPQRPIMHSHDDHAPQLERIINFRGLRVIVGVPDSVQPTENDIVIQQGSRMDTFPSTSWYRDIIRANAVLYDEATRRQKRDIVDEIYHVIATDQRRLLRLQPYENIKGTTWICVACPRGQVSTALRDVIRNL